MSKISKNYYRKTKIKIKCAAFSCCNNTIERPSLKFFAFPKDVKLARIWAINAGREDIAYTSPATIRKYVLCAEHFEDEVFKSDYEKQDFKNNLYPIPTIFNNNFNNYVQKGSSYDLEVKLPTEINVSLFYDNLFNFEFGRLNYTDNCYDNIFPYSPDVFDRFMKRGFCRLCAKSLPITHLVSLYSDNYADMLKLCLPGKLDINDKLPQEICYDCINKLQSCYNILKIFIDADNNLRTLFGECREEEKNCTFNTRQSEPETVLQTNNEADKNLISEEKLNGLFFDAEPLQNCSEIINSNKLNNDEEKTNNVSFLSPSAKNDIDDTLIETNPSAQPYKNVDETVQIKFQCVKCLKLFSCKKEILQHVSTEHPDSGHKLDYKVVKVRKKFDLKKLPEFHSSTARYECLICSTHHLSKNSLIKHIRLRHSAMKEGNFFCRIIKAERYKKNVFNCLRCGEMLTSLNRYRRHMQKHVEYKCDRCDLSFDKVYKLKNHLKTHKTPKVYSCIGCHDEFNSKYDLNKHENIHKQPREDVSCAKCGKNFTSAFALRKHKQIHESSLCNICGKLFPTEKYLNNHLQTHSNERPFSCTTCAKSFKTMATLVKHKTSHQPDKNYVCQVCGKQFRTQGILSQHMKVHSTAKPHVCDICGKAFNRSGNLRKHRECHKFISETEFNRVTGDKKLFSCKVCHKTFRIKYQMQIHYRLHSGERPYKCEFCDKSFRSKASLNQHRLIHGNVFPHECDFCDRKFRRQQSLIVHRKTHTGERPFPCPICGRAFANRGDMIKHKRIHLKKSEKVSSTVSGC